MHVPTWPFKNSWEKLESSTKGINTKGINDIESNMSYSCPHVYSEINNVIFIQIMVIAQRGAIEPM